ncbi:Antitoxin EndoAI [Anoxybacillus sp. BCO1]|nr:Antitoxin EndoAI [Anoxybacillus sp. BCO1]
MSESSATTEIVIRLPQALVSELDGIVKQENGSRNELIYQAMKMYIRETEKTSNSRSDETWVYGDGEN